MKKVFSAAVISSLLFAMQVTTGFAKVNKNIPAFLPLDTDIYMEFDFTAENPFSDMIKKMIDETRNDETPFNEPGNIIASTAINNGTAAIALSLVPGQYGSDIEGYLIVDGVTQDEFEKFSADLVAAQKKIDEYFENDFPLEVQPTTETDDNVNEIEIGEETPITEPLAPLPGAGNEPEAPTPAPVAIELYKDAVIHKINGDTFGHIKGQYLVLSDSTETIKRLVDIMNDSNKEKLANDATFQRISNDFMDTGFMHMYFSGSLYQEFIRDLGLNGADQKTLAEQAKLIKGVGMSVNQRASSFNFISRMILDEEAQQAMNFHPDQYNFIPRLSKEFSSENALLFVEQYNIQKQISDLWPLISSDPNAIEELATLTDSKSLESEAVNAELVKNFGINFQELRDLTSQHFAIAAYDNGELVPGATLALNVTGHTDAAERITNFLNGKLLTEFADMATKTSTRVAGKELTTIKIQSEVPEMNFLVTIGVVNNNLILSTDSKIKEHYGQNGISGLIDNDKHYNSISYLYLRGAGGYIERISELFGEAGAPNGNRIFPILFAPFGEATFTSEAQADWLKTSGNFEIDTTKFSQYEEIPAIMFERSYNEFDDNFTFPGELDDNLELTEVSPLCDVDGLGAESQDAITELGRIGVINGDSDGCYHPTRAINRAEFITLINRAYDLSIVSGPSQQFSDVPDNAWFADSVKNASTVGIIRGYEDGSFRPDQPITRAEAVKIINAAANHNPAAQKTTSFNDIKDTDWFYVDVITAQENGIIGQSDNFRPGDSLTREEAALMINRALNR